MADKFIQRFRYGNPKENEQAHSDQWASYEGIGEGLGVEKDQVFKRGYEDPTYLTFRIEFGDWGTSINGPSTVDTKATGITSYPAYAAEYDDLPCGLLDCHDTDTFTDKTQYYNAYNFLRSRNEDKRALYLKAFRNGLYAIAQKTPYVFSKINGIGALSNFNQKGAMRVKDATITIDCIEGLDLKIKTLMTWYRKAAWDDIYQRWMLPENMREFKMIIYIYEQRNFHHIDLDDNVANKFTPATFNKSLNESLPVYALECEPCEFVIENVFGDAYDKDWHGNQMANTSIKIKVKNVRTYLKNGLLADTLAKYVIYDLQDQLDRGSLSLNDNLNTVNSVKQAFMKKTIWDDPYYDEDKGDSFWYDVIMSGQLVNSNENLLSASTWKNIGKRLLNVITSSKKHIMGKGGVNKNGNMATSIMNELEFSDLASKYLSPVSENPHIYDPGYDMSERQYHHDFLQPDMSERVDNQEFIEPDLRDRQDKQELLEPDMSERDQQMSFLEPDMSQRQYPSDVMQHNEEEREVPDLTPVVNEDPREIDMQMLEHDAERDKPSLQPIGNDKERTKPTLQPIENDAPRDKRDLTNVETDDARKKLTLQPIETEEPREPMDFQDIRMEDARDVQHSNFIEPDMSERKLDNGFIEPNDDERIIDNAFLRPDMSERDVSTQYLKPDQSERTFNSQMSGVDQSERTISSEMNEVDQSERNFDMTMLEVDQSERSTNTQYPTMDEARDVRHTNFVEPQMDERQKDGLNYLQIDGPREVIPQNMLRSEQGERSIDNAMVKPIMDERTIAKNQMAGVLQDERSVENDIHQVPMEARKLDSEIHASEMQPRDTTKQITSSPMEARDVNVTIANTPMDARDVPSNIDHYQVEERQKPTMVMNKTEYTNLLSKATTKTTREFAKIDETNRKDEEKSIQMLKQANLDDSKFSALANKEDLQMVKLFVDDNGNLRKSFEHRVQILQGDLRDATQRVLDKQPMAKLDDKGNPKGDDILVTPDMRERLIDNAKLVGIDQETVRTMSYQALVGLHETISNALEKTIQAQPIEGTKIQSKVNEKTNEDKKVLTDTKVDDKAHKKRPLLGHTLEEPRDKKTIIL